jgi:hypothetical protein
VLTAVILIATVLVVNLVWTVASLALFRLVGARVTEVTYGPLPISLTRTIGGVKTELTPLPSAAIRVLGRGPEDRDDSARSWRRLSLARRLTALIGPWVVVLGLPCALLGPAHAVRSFAHGVQQLLFVLDLTPLVRAFRHVIEVAPFATTLGVVCAKAIAVSVLPAIGTAGSGVLAELARPAKTGRAPAARRGNLWIVPALAAYLYIGLRLAYAIARAWIG